MATHNQQIATELRERIATAIAKADNDSWPDEPFRLSHLSLTDDILEIVVQWYKEHPVS